MSGSALGDAIVSPFLSALAARIGKQSGEKVRLRRSEMCRRCAIVVDAGETISLRGVLLVVDGLRRWRVGVVVSRGRL